MGGTSKQTQSYNNQTNSQPWAPAQPELQSILGQASGISSNLNPLEQSAISQMTANSQAIPNYGPQAQGLVNSYLTGDPTGLLNPALSAYNSALSPIATADLDPTKTPGIQALLDTIRSDVSNQVNGQFAGAGRDLSGLNQQTLARGISQGEAAPLLAQYNQNVQNRMGAASGLFGAGLSGSQAMTKNQGNALNILQSLPGLSNVGQQGVIDAQGLLRSIPLQTLQSLAGITVPIAGLGGQTNSAGQSVNYNQASPAQTFAQWAGGIGSLFPKAPITGNTFSF